MKEVKRVFETTNYKQFKTIKGNRDINIANLKRLEKSMKGNYLMSPILVNENYEVIDGQHRLKCCVSLSLPVRFIIVDGYGVDEMQALNTISNNWKFNDFINCYADLGYRDYEIIRDFNIKYNLPQTITLNILSDYKNSIGSDSRILFNQGRFKVKNYIKAVQFAEKIEVLSLYFERSKGTSFIKAILKAKEVHGFNLDKFVSKVKKYPTLLIACTNEKDYLKVIENVYNYRSRGERVRLY